MTTSPVDRPRPEDPPEPPTETSPPLRGRLGHEPAVSVVALGAGATLGVVTFDLVLAGHLTLFFDLCFMVLCLTLALAVRGQDFFTVAVLPPLLMLGTFVLLAATRPTALAEADHGVVQTVVTGLAHHSVALVVGHLLCLGALAVRHRFRTQATGTPTPTP